MPTPGTERTITIDANVFQYCFQVQNGHRLPDGLEVNRIQDFCNQIFEQYSIAINDFIKTEYSEQIGQEVVPRLLKTRLQKGLAIEVDICLIDNPVRSRLKIDYRFSCNSRDANYIKTSINTVFRYLVTENKRDFFKEHCRSGRMSMDKYLNRELGLTICTIDGGCEILLDE